MPKNLAITIAGAVSLGSYEAGVLWEVIDAIRQHNEDPQTLPDDKVIVDVLTGASAGGMTAIILAQKLLYNRSEFAGPYDNPLYATWVKGISLTGLQDTGDTEKALDSIFSSDLIEEISKSALLKRYETSQPPPPEPHPAVDGKLRVGVALTNLNGIGYGYQVKPAGEFTYLDYSDQLTRPILADQCDTEDFWEPLRKAAVACGAFPFAFRTQSFERSKKADPDDYVSPNLEWKGEPRTYTYSDGGILRNQPLGMAKNLVDQIDCHTHERRYYMFVSPHAKDPSPSQFDPTGVNFFQALKRIVALVTGQSGFQDWITAHEVNERVRLLDQRACELAQVIKDGKIEAGSLAATADSLLDLLFKAGDNIPLGATQVESRQAAQTRIAKQYSVEAASLADNQRQAFLDAVLAFETAAQLGARDFMTIYGVTADDGELAGAGLQSFLGFFDQRFRDHDYDIGRTHAQKFLADDVLKAVAQMGPLRYVPTEIRPIDKSLNGLGLDQLGQNDIKPFRQGMERRVKQMLSELPGGWGLAGPIAEIVIHAVITHMMPGVKGSPTPAPSPDGR